MAKGREPAGAREKWGREARWSRVRRDFGVCESGSIQTGRRRVSSVERKKKRKRLEIEEWERTRLVQRCLDECAPRVGRLSSPNLLFPLRVSRRRCGTSRVTHDESDVDVRSPSREGSMARCDEVRLEQDGLVCVRGKVSEDRGEEERRGEDVHLPRHVEDVERERWM